MKKRVTADRAADDEERELVAAYEAGEFKPVRDQSEEKRIAVAAAKRYTSAGLSKRGFRTRA